MIRRFPRPATHEDVFVDRYDALRRQAVYLTGRLDDAEDLVQDAFIRFTLVRPNLGDIANLEGYLPGASLYVDDPAVPGGRRFNPGAFVIPTDIRQGNLPRNALRGFPVWQLDMAIHRQFHLSSRLGVQARVEAFNVLNHPNFGDPTGNLSSALFGVSSTMTNRSLGSGGADGGFNPLYQLGGLRSLQLACKFIF